MLIGFGFGSPLTALLMLIVTSLASFLLFRAFSGSRRPGNPVARRDQLRKYYYQQRELARRLSREFDVSDDEIEERIERETGR